MKRNGKKTYAVAHPSNDPPRIQSTGDGSPTLFSPLYEATYHSVHGALTESEHVFIRNGLKFWLSHNEHVPIVHVLEMGLGTGLNALLTCLHMGDSNRMVQYEAWEKHPLPHSVWQALDFPVQDKGQFNQWLKVLHKAEMDIPVTIGPWFVLVKKNNDLLKEKPVGPFDVIYYDAFGPETQPEVWTTETLAAVCQTLASGGVFVTYCAKGDVRRSLISLGLDVQRLPGPPGKREMLRAIKL